MQQQGLFIFESVKSIPATAHAKVISWHASHLNSVSRCTSGDDVTKIVLAYQPFGRSSGRWGLLGHAQTHLTIACKTPAVTNQGQVYQLNEPSKLFMIQVANSKAKLGLCKTADINLLLCL